MPGLALYLLGPFAATLDEQPFGGFHIRPAQALVVYLACQAQAHSREQLMDLLWPESAPADAAHSLRQALYVLRRVLPEVVSRDNTRPVPLVVAAQDTLQINPQAAVTVDVHQFAALLRDAGPDEARRAVALYRGDFLSDFYLPHSAPFEEWVAARRADLCRQMMDALASLSEQARQQRAFDEMAAYARRHLTLDDLSESAHRQLMWALANSGKRVEAVTHYQRLVELLDAELGIAPSAETRDLAERIAGTSEAWVPAVPVQADAAPGARRRHNLPRQLSSLIGRQPEIAAVQGLLTAAPLVTLTGAGGCGKTRLALAVAERSLDTFTDGVWLTEFAPLTDPALVPQALADTLGLSDRGGRSIAAVLVDSLCAKNSLLVLDNCEHLLGACAGLSETLLRACPNVRILATSREVLGVNGETTYTVPSLATADPEALPPLPELARVEASQLFVERAGSARTGFALTPDNAPAVARICRRLDGIPLAIELAAARVRALSPQQIAQRLDSGFLWLAGGGPATPERQQTLRATIDWSYNLLTPPEQTLLNRLAVFAGGWTLEAAEAVGAGGGLEPAAILGLLIQLVEKSLVQAYEQDGDMRYRCLETVRQYATERLQASGELEPIRRRHLDHFLAFACRGDPELRGPRSVEWTMRMAREHDNFRAALEYAFTPGQAATTGPQLAIALAGTTGFGFWDKRSHMTEAAYWLRRALDHDSVSPGSALRAKLLFHYCVDANFVETWETLQPLLEESLAIFQALGESYRVDRAYVLMWLGWWLYFRAERELGYRYSWEALQIFRESGELWGQAFALNFLSTLKLEDEQPAAALELVEEGLAVAQACGDRHSIAILLSNLGEIRVRLGHYCEGRPYLEESLTLLAQFGNKGFPCQILKLLGDAARATGDYGQAEAHYQHAWSMARDMDWLSYGTMVAAALGFTRLHRGETEAAIASFAEARAMGQVYGRKFMPTYYLLCLGAVSAAQGQPELGAQLFGAFDAQIQLQLAQGYTMISLLDAVDRLELDSYAAICRSALGDAEYDRLFAVGQRLSVAEATAFTTQIQGVPATASSSP